MPAIMDERAGRDFMIISKQHLGQLYSLNTNGSGHDGSSGIEIPQTHADFFRGLGYEIDQSNILESIELSCLDPNKYELVTLNEENT